MRFLQNRRKPIPDVGKLAASSSAAGIEGQCAVPMITEYPFLSSIRYMSIRPTSVEWIYSRHRTLKPDPIQYRNA
jgi:hypothetical protein